MLQPVGIKQPEFGLWNDTQERAGSGVLRNILIGMYHLQVSRLYTYDSEINPTTRKETTVVLWHYYDSDGQKHGPYSCVQLQCFARQGTIRPETIMVTEEGQTIPARAVEGLTFSEIKPLSLPPSPRPPASPVEENPFVAPMPGEQNPVVVQGNKGVSWRSIARTFKIIVFLLTLATVAGITGSIIWGSLKLNTVAYEHICDGLSNRPFLEITAISVVWADKPSVFATVKSFGSNTADIEEESVLSASGEFTVKTKTTEKFYESVDTESGLRELDITNTHEREFNVAMEKYQGLPMAHQNNLHVPQNLSQFQFYKDRIPEGEEVALAGSIGLTKNAKDWQKDDIQIDTSPIKHLIPKSQLHNAHKLDDLATKAAVQAAILARRDFVAKVDEAIADLKKRDEIAVATIKKELSDRFLEVFDDSNISVRWSTEDAISVSGTFSAKAKAKETFYQSVGQEDALRELGIPITYEQEFNAAKERVKSLPELHRTNFTNAADAVVAQLSRFQFYRVHTREGEEVTRTGNIELTKNANKDWQGRTRVDSPEGLCLEFQLGVDTKKRDDPQIREMAEEIIQARKNFVDRLKPTHDFDKFCKPGMEYRGSCEYGLATLGVHIVFERNVGPNKVTGTIKYSFFTARIEPRNFSLDVDVEKMTDYPVTGKLDAFVPKPARDVGLTGNEEGFKAAADVMLARDVKIRFTNEMEFVLIVNGRDVKFKLSAVNADAPSPNQRGNQQIREQLRARPRSQ